MIPQPRIEGYLTMLRKSASKRSELLAWEVVVDSNISNMNFLGVNLKTTTKPNVTATTATNKEIYPDKQTVTLLHTITRSIRNEKGIPRFNADIPTKCIVQIPHPPRAKPPSAIHETGFFLIQVEKTACSIITSEHHEPKTATINERKTKSPFHSILNTWPASIFTCFFLSPNRYVRSNL